ncbi:MAG: hypothetical protein Q4P36_04260 [Bowdeniella nasicola]|nr:hypothetical protein [Bowdeniella nasicola]
MSPIRRALAGACAGLLAASLAGCADSPLPEPSSAASYQGPAITDDRLAEVINAIGEEVVAADAAQDPEQLKLRMTGAALAARSAQYTLATKSEGDRKPTALSFAPQLLMVPALADFPRHAAFVSSVPEGHNSPVLVSLVQEQARTPYHVDHWARLFPGVTFPQMPSTQEGVTSLAIDDTSLKTTPADALASYQAAINEPAGDTAKALGADPLRTSIQETVKALTDSLAEVGEASWTAGPPGEDIIALRTADGGAVVLGTVPTTLELKKTVRRAKLQISDDLATLAGDEPVANTLKASYQIMVALYVPAKDSDESIAPLGGEQVLLKATRDE